MKQESMIIRFESEGHQIDSETLIDTLTTYTEIIALINQMAGDGHRKIDLKINALESGSFEINIELVENIITSLFSKEAVGYTASIITILGAVFSLHKYFKGKPIKEDEIGLSEDILKESGNSNPNVSIELTLNVYNSQPTRTKVSKFIKTANNDTAITGIKLISKDKDLVSIPKSQFAELVYDDFDKETVRESIRHVISKDANLRIITLSFESKKQWEFVFEGFTIKLPVQDETLSALIDEGMRFAKGDSLKVDLEITQEYDHRCDAYRNKKYRIARFIEHIPRPEQSRLEFSE